MTENQKLNANFIGAFIVLTVVFVLLRIFPDGLLAPVVNNLINLLRLAAGFVA